MNNAPRVRLGNQVVAINAGPRLQRLPQSVVTSIKAAKVVPPRKGVIAEARLDPSKGEAIKKLNGNPMSAAPAIANAPNVSGQGPKKLSGGKTIPPAGSVAEATQYPHDKKRKRMTASNNVEAQMPQTNGGGKRVTVQSARKGAAAAASGACAPEAVQPPANAGDARAAASWPAEGRAASPADGEEGAEMRSARFALQAAPMIASLDGWPRRPASFLPLTGRLSRL
ncbi:hypothetical protein [Mesorhizobium sp. LjNodule214]|uniref:hypothetical protein n=1 Tax=Mesorhizobium sp. LjNodule214 TaxID=3342252 RepID=UPI003ECE964F